LRFVGLGGFRFWPFQHLAEFFQERLAIRHFRPAASPPTGDEFFVVYVGFRGFAVVLRLFAGLSESKWFLRAIGFLSQRLIQFRKEPVCLTRNFHLFFRDLNQFDIDGNYSRSLSSRCPQSSHQPDDRRDE